VLAGLDSAGAVSVRRLGAAGAPDTRFGVNGVLRIALTWPETPWMYQTWVSPQGYLNLVTETTPYTATSEVALRRYQLVGDIVEFRNAPLDHYFVTYDGDEALGIDAGAAGRGWSRTGAAFRPGGTTPVCRFYGTPGVGPNSHFFTASKDECDIVKRSPGWTYEGLGFYTTPPVSGQCATGLKAVHRLYNNRAAQNDSNHRFVTDTAVIPAMTAQGWVHEGVVFCAKS
jgi:serine protease